MQGYRIKNPCKKAFVLRADFHNPANSGSEISGKSQKAQNIGNLNAIPLPRRAQLWAEFHRFESRPAWKPGATNSDKID